MLPPAVSATAVSVIVTISLLPVITLISSLKLTRLFLCSSLIKLGGLPLRAIIISCFRLAAAYIIPSFKLAGLFLDRKSTRLHSSHDH